MKLIKKSFSKLKSRAALLASWIFCREKTFIKKIGGKRKNSSLALLALILICLVSFQNCSSSLNKGFAVSAQQEASVSAAPNSLSGGTTYTWVGTNWNSCSAQCGGGTQSRNVSCQDSKGEVVSESSCSQPKPAVSQSCQTQACTSYFWVQSGFSPCSKSCGGGVQTQTVTCSSDKGQSVAESFCNQPKPAMSQSCNVQSCNSSPRDELTGKFFSFVATQAVAEAVYLQVGTLIMNDNGTVVGIVWVEDTRNTDYWVSVDSKLVNPMNVPDPSLLKSSGSCSPGYLKMPGLIGSPQNLNGTWAMNGNNLVVTLGPWTMTWQKDAGFSQDSWKLVMATGYWNTFGYAFLSKQSPLSVTTPITDSHLATSYSGNLDHNNTGQAFGTWLSVPLAVSWFGRTTYSDPDVVSTTAYTNSSAPSAGDGSSIYGYYNLSRNDRNRSRNMLFEYFGHDYNDDGCANESGGHARLLYGVFDEAQQKITRFLLIESSGPNSGNAGPVPIISVGRAIRPGGP